MLLALIGSICTVGPVNVWVALHRNHHLNVNTKKDYICPNHNPIWHVWFLTMYEIPDMKKCFDIIKDKDLKVFVFCWLIINILYWIICYFFGIIFICLIAQAFIWVIIGMVNVFGHKKTFLNESILHMICPLDQQHLNHHKNSNSFNINNLDIFSKLFFGLIKK